MGTKRLRQVESIGFRLGVEHENNRLRPLLERFLALFEDGDADSCGPAAGIRVVEVLADLRRELGKEG